MKMIDCKCPNCGALLQASEDREYWFCGFCGAKFLVQQAITQNTIINNNSISADVVNVFGDLHSYGSINRVLQKADSFMKLNDFYSAQNVITDALKEYPENCQLWLKVLQIYFSRMFFTKQIEGFDTMTYFEAYQNLLTLCDPSEKRQYQSFWLENWNKIADLMRSGEMAWDGSFYPSKYGLKPNVAQPSIPSPLQPIFNEGKENADRLNEAGLFFDKIQKRDENGKLVLNEENPAGFYLKESKLGGDRGYIEFAFGTSIYTMRNYGDGISHYLFKSKEIIKTDSESIDRYLREADELQRSQEAEWKRIQAAQEEENRLVKERGWKAAIDAGICPKCSVKLTQTIFGRKCRYCKSKY